MKKAFLVLAIVFASVVSANAQWWVGGGLGADIQKNSTGFSLSPEVGYMIPDSPFTVALGVGYAFDKVKGLGSTNALTLQPYFRYVPCTIGEKFSLFLDLTGDFGLFGGPKKDAWAVMVQPGIAWMATDKWTAAFRLGKIGYDHNFYSTDGFLTNFDLSSPSIRIYYNF